MFFNDQNFQEDAMNFQGVVLVDFFAEWCGPCKMQGPIMDELAEEFKNNSNVKIGKMNVDESPVTAEKFNVMSIPALVLIKSGKEIETMVGLQSKAALKEKIEELL